MKILLTGGGGMVGRNVLAHPHSKNFIIFSPSSIELNLLDINAIDIFLSRYQPDVIIHSAGVVGGIQANIKNPTKFFSDNILMGINLINSAKKNNIKKLLNLGSSCMYPRNCSDAITEDMVLKGELEPTNEGYALAKIASARLCHYIRKEEPDFLYKTIIPCNLYGKYDKFDAENSHMIPGVIRKISYAVEKNIPVIDIWGSGEARREFMYAEDLADFIFYSLNEFEKIPDVLNVGMGKDYSINEYYKIIANIIGFKGTFAHDLSKPTGMMRKLIDATLLSDFGWKYKTELEVGIRKTYQYFLTEINND